MTNMRTFDYGTKYSYELISSLNMFDTTPNVILNTEHRANTKAFKAEVKEIGKAMSAELGKCVGYHRYSNRMSAVWSMGYIR